MSVCHLVSAGSFAEQHFHPHEKDLVIACDGGYNHLAARGIKPDLLIGDLDSLVGAVPSDLPVLHLPIEKDDTDTLYALRIGLSKGYRHFALHGCLGGTRLSHTLANLQLLSFLEKNGANGVIYGENTAVYLLKNSKMVFSASKRGYLSVLAHSSTARVKLTGLKYPFDGILSSDTPLGVSNEFTGQEAEIEILHGSVVAIVEGKELTNF